MLRDVSPTAIKGAVSCFIRVRVMSGCLREFAPALILDDVEDLINQEVQGGEGDRIFGLCRRWGSVLLGS